MAVRTPHEIARDAVRQLTANRLPPTPENFQSAYHEIAGTRPLRPFPLEPLRRIAQELPDRSPGQQRLKAQFESAVSQHNWDAVQNALVAYVGLGPAPARPLGGLAAPGTQAPSNAQPPATTSLPADLLEQMARIVDHALPAVGNEDAKLGEQGQDLITLLRAPQPEVAALRKLMANFAFRLSFVAEEQSLVRETLLGLMHLLFENIGELSQDNPWIKGQMDALMQAATPPLNMRRLEELQSRLKDVIHKQSEAKARTLEAQAQIKEALGGFIDRLGRMTEESGHFSDQIENCARQLERAQELSDITPVLQEAIRASRSMATDARRATDELNELRDRTTEAEIEIARLQQELDRLSEMARHDPLTGTLNRKGLDEAVERELARAQRRQSQVCLGLLDIDNFKKLNDTHGHDTGDAALVHLSEVVRTTLRPQDSIARYGGEEFVIVMPDTSLEQAVEAMTRVQRTLTTQLFMRGNERLLITFSAGVAQWQAGETGVEVIRRADQGMYLAKRAGKNRVVAV